jgi:phosphoesterase RecJ-like protein
VSEPPDARAQVLDELQRANRFILVAHENPDGDALGSLVAMHELLDLLGKENAVYIAPDDLPLPREYRFLDLSYAISTTPDDVHERTVIFLDCGNIDRNPAEELRQPGMHILNIDHHHDNTRFGTVNLVEPDASCTAEIIWSLVSDLGVRPNKAMADALYVGLITDTGKFMYENTSPRSHIMAAELIEAGVDVQRMNRLLFEDVPHAKVQLLARALCGCERYDDGALIITELSLEDYKATGAEDHDSEGVIDHLRGVEGTLVAALVRELRRENASGRRKVSLRAADPSVDVSRIARAQGGGGHRQAAGFTTDLDREQLVAFLREEVATQR